MDMPRQRETVEVITSDQRRRRWSAAQKQALVRRTYEPGMSVSLVARQEGVSASLLFQWRKLDRQGALVAVSAGEAVVPASELAAARAEIAKLQRILGKKTLENEILREAVEISVEKSGLRARPCCPRTRHEDGLRHFGRGALEPASAQASSCRLGRWSQRPDADLGRRAGGGDRRRDCRPSKLRLSTCRGALRRTLRPLHDRWV